MVNNHPIPKLEPKENDGYCKLSPLWLVFVVISKSGGDITITYTPARGWQNTKQK